MRHGRHQGRQRMHDPLLTSIQLPSQRHPPLRSRLQFVGVICRHVVQMGDGAPAASADKAAVIAAVVAAAKADMAADRKTTALKSLQVQDCHPSVANRPATLLRQGCHNQPPD